MPEKDESWAKCAETLVFEVNKKKIALSVKWLSKLFNIPPGFLGHFQWSLILTFGVNENEGFVLTDDIGVKDGVYG